MPERVHVEKRGRVALLTIDHPPMNVLDAEVAEALFAAVGEVMSDDGVSVGVIAGAGERAFVAGADIKGFPAVFEVPERARELARGLHALMDRIDQSPKPFIAAIHGFALGGGLELALACDFRVCDVDARMGLPEVNLGLLPGAGGTQRLPRLIGEARAKLLMMTGEAVDAGTAERFGLVNVVTEPGQHIKGALVLAQTLASKSLPALTRIKCAVDRGLESPLTEGLAFEADLFGELLVSEDAREGVQAFIEKRKPQFRHR